MVGRWMLPLALTVLGCKNEVDCSLPPPTEFSDVWDLTEASVETLLATTDATTRDELTCDDVCSYAHDERLGDPPEQIDTCVLDLDTAAGATADTVVGTVTCAGISLRYYCI